MIVWLIYDSTLNVSVSMIVCFFVFYITTIFYSVFTIASYAYIYCHTITKTGSQITLRKMWAIAIACWRHPTWRNSPKSNDFDLETRRFQRSTSVIYINKNDSNRVILSKHRFDGVFGRRNYCFIMLLARLFSGIKKSDRTLFCLSINIIFLP